MDVGFGRLSFRKRLRRIKLLRKKSRKAHAMIRASSGHTAPSTANLTWRLPVLDQKCCSHLVQSAAGSKFFKSKLILYQQAFCCSGYHLFPQKLAQKMEAV